jgi:hypothetical protein
MVLINKVVPSASARATAMTPTKPAPPELFSTMTVWPIEALSFGARMRATRSWPPPAGNATMILASRPGKPSSATAPAAKAAVIARANRIAQPIRRMIVDPVRRV